jgi:hypothetical protein
MPVMKKSQTNQSQSKSPPLKDTAKKSSPAQASSKSKAPATTPAKTNTTSGKDLPKDSPTAPAKHPERPILYPNPNVLIYVSDASKAPDGKANPLTAAIAKDILGWQEESENIKFDKNFRLIDRNERKVRTYNNVANRPYYKTLAEEYMLEILRGKWQLNFENVKIDRTGLIHDGQHRLVGLVFAVQEWQKDRQRTLEGQLWQAQWPTEPCIDMLVCTGMDGSDEVVNTIGTGKFRSLKDVLYRCEWFAKRGESERRELAGMTRFAIECLYRRTGTKMDRDRRYGTLNFTPKFSHSEYLAFLNDHETLLEFINDLYMEGVKKLRPLKLTGGNSAALMYLMAVSGTDDDGCDTYDRDSNEHALDWSMKDKAMDFWHLIAGNSPDVEPLTEALLKIPDIWSKTYQDQLAHAYVIQAWNVYSSGKKAKPKDMEEIVWRATEYKVEIDNVPLIAGIDRGPHPEGNPDLQDEE